MLTHISFTDFQRMQVSRILPFPLPLVDWPGGPGPARCPGEWPRAVKPLPPRFAALRRPRQPHPRPALVGHRRPFRLYSLRPAVTSSFLSRTLHVRAGQAFRPHGAPAQPAGGGDAIVGDVTNPPGVPPGPRAVLQRRLCAQVCRGAPAPTGVGPRSPRETAAGRRRLRPRPPRTRTHGTGG